MNTNIQQSDNIAPANRSETEVNKTDNNPTQVILPADLTTVAEQIGNRLPPTSMENIVSEIDRGEWDRDGDGIPDDYDHDKNRTRADIGAEINRLGKYTPTRKDGWKFAKNSRGLLKTALSGPDSIAQLNPMSLKSRKSDQSDTNNRRRHKKNIGIESD